MAWEPLHPGDPFPADNEGMRVYGEAVRGTGELIVEQITLLRRLGDQESWVTDTAEAFREKAEELADAISQARDRYLETGAALTTLADQLDEHERQAEIRRSEAEGIAATANSAEIEPTAGEDGSPGELTQSQRSANRARSDAISRMGELQREFDGIVSDAEDDARAAEAKIDTAKDDDVKDGFWEKHAGWIRTVAGVIAAIAAVVLLTVATGGTIWLVAMVVAVAAGITALVMSVGRYATGNGPWYDIAFDAVGVLTLGTGGLALKALSKGFPALKGAYASFMGTRAGAASLSGMQGSLNAAVRFSASNFPRTAAIARRNLVDIHHTAALADDTARTAAAVSPTLTRLQRFVLGGKETGALVSHVRDIRTTLAALDNVPVGIVDDLAVSTRNANTYIQAINVNSVNQLASLTTGTLTDPTSPDNPVGLVQVIIDVVGRSQ